jgi:hypothetical protein
VSEFEVQVWRRGHEPLRCYTTSSTHDILTEVTTGSRPLYLEVDKLLRQEGEKPDVCLGVIFLWLNADGMAWLTLAEHRDHHVSDPLRVGLTGEVGGFFDDTAGPLAFPTSNVITAEQAARALGYWLDCGGQLSGLTWS